MKKLALVIAMAIGVASIAVAQGVPAKSKTDHKERHEHRIATMKKDLDLSDDQVMKMRAIHAKYHSERETARQIEDASARKSEMMRISKAQKKELGAVLTEEQKAKFREIRKEERQKRIEAEEHHDEKPKLVD